MILDGRGRKQSAPGPSANNLMWMSKMGCLALLAHFYMVHFNGAFRKRLMVQLRGLLE